MKPLPSDIWGRLKGNIPQREELTARVADPDVTKQLFAALDSGERRHLLILLNTQDEGLSDNQSRGILVTTRELGLLEQGVSRYIDLVCVETAGHTAFDVIGGEIAQELARTDQPPAVVVQKVLSRWRRFWGQLPLQVLSREAQLGLFAEVWFLDKWMVDKLGPGQAVSRWRGPLRGRHDFEWVGGSIEAKATFSTRGRLHRIHGLEQLIAPEGGELLLFSLRVREEAGADNTLGGAVNACREHLKSDDEALTQFDIKLVHAGYSPAHEEEYGRVRLRIVDEGLFRVHQNFPRLTLADLRDGLAPGVEYVEYDINLTGFEHLILAKTPAEMPVI